MSKSDWGVEGAREACAIGGRSWRRCMEELEPGITQLDIQKRILGYYYEEGADLSSETPTVLGATGAGGAAISAATAPSSAKTPNS